MGVLEIRGLRKVYGESGSEIVAVDDLDITVEDGEFLVLVGPSGCGKSTTLRCIAGLESITEGDVLLDGKSIVNKKPKDRNIAMVFQSYALYPHMSAFDNMAFSLRMTSDLSSVEIEKKVMDAAEVMGIEDLLDKKPDELSGGQQQRVALGRAIVRDPEVFLLDEPLSNLDAKLRTQMRTELQRLQNELAVTTVYVTHDQTEAMTMGDKIAVLDDGQLQHLGTPLECYHEPANRFVAGFIGSPSMNFVEVQNRNGLLEGSSFTYELSEETARLLSDAPASLTLGIRPEDIRILDGQSHKNSIPVTVNVVEPMGDVRMVYARMGDQSLVISTSGDRIIRTDDRISVLFPEDRLHVFDSETDEAIKNREWDAAKEEMTRQA